MSGFKDKAEFKKVTAKAETAQALLVTIDEEDHWIPKSQIDDDSEVFGEGHSGTLVVSQWIAEQRKLV